MQCPLAGSYSDYLEKEGGIWEQAYSSVNIPWLLALSVSMGNAYTKGLAQNAQVFCEPEWGFDVSGGGKDIGPGQQMVTGGSTGGLIVAW